MARKAASIAQEPYRVQSTAKGGGRDALPPQHERHAGALNENHRHCSQDHNRPAQQQPAQQPHNGGGADSDPLALPLLVLAAALGQRDTVAAVARRYPGAVPQLEGELTALLVLRTAASLGQDADGLEQQLRSRYPTACGLWLCGQAGMAAGQG